MVTLEQKLAELEQKTARIKDKIKKQDTAEKVVIGGMMLAYARKNPNNAKRLLEIMQSELREQDLKRVQRAVDNLNLIVGNAQLATLDGGSYANP
ncbi:MAG: mobilization protein [Haemophilus parainfluenzae]|nr:mobilization protein [Haemophilus parainfluenzae]